MTVYRVCNCLQGKQRVVKNKQAKLSKQTPDEYEKKNKETASQLCDVAVSDTEQSAGLSNMFLSGRSICSDFFFLLLHWLLQYMYLLITIVDKNIISTRRNSTFIMW